MSKSSSYFLYSIAQYVHSRREERLNVGVVVFEPDSGRVTARFEPAEATRRIKMLYPEVDRKGLELYLESLASSLRRRSLPTADHYSNPLDALAAEWQNIIRLTPARPVPGASAAAAAERLLSVYLTTTPAEAKRQLRGVERARQRTLEAIRTVLELDIPEMGYRMDYTFEVPFEWQGKRHNIIRQFAFLLRERFAVDTISLEGSGNKGPESEAELFIAKAKDIRKRSQGYILPYATVSIDPDREEMGRNLIAYMLDRGGLEEGQVVEARDAEKLMEGIRDKLAA